MLKRLSTLIFLLLFSSSPFAAQNDFVAIPGGEHELIDGKTGIKVTVSVGSFRIAGTEVTQKEFSKVMGFNPSHYRGDDRPVENVSWWDAVKFCNLKSIRDGVQPCYDLLSGECDLSKNGYRLPTDAEWSLAFGKGPDFDAEKIHQLANIGSGDTKNTEQLMRRVQNDGTSAVAAYPPNAAGLYDMLGNVWEWCTDYYNPQRDHPMPLKNPVGPLWGLERVIRGGSFVTSTSGWNKELRSSMRPDYKSRFTGFRICRSAVEKPALTNKKRDRFFLPYNNVPDDFNKRGELAPLLVDSSGHAISSLDEWYKRREALRIKWRRLLGVPSMPPPAPQAFVVKKFTEERYTEELLYLQVEPGLQEKILIMRPDEVMDTPTPVVIVPYYDVDVPAGRNLGGRSFTSSWVRSFAYLAVQHGCIAVAVRWFGESYGEKYDEAVANLKLRHPGCTGLGKWVWDASRVVDYVVTLPEVDHDAIGIIGHSLGAKLALYAAAFDDRIKVAVASEGGIGLNFSNYDDYWYFGDFIRRLNDGTDQHELLALMAPRPFLLIGGDAYDGDESWLYINAAKEVYRLFAKPRNIGYFNHHSGHSPTPEAVRAAMDWLDYFLRDDGS